MLLIDGPRLLRRLDQLATVGADPAGGVTRLAYAAEDARARELVAGWLADAGADVRTDPAGNLIGERAGREDLPWLATGSHLDTVVQAGPLDGAYGVVAAVEVLAALSDRPLRHPLRLVGFSNEEGARGTPGMVGSRAVAGRPLDLEAGDDEGVTLGQRLLDGGGDPDRLARAAWAPGEVAAFLELHIEQGPVLEVAGLQAGVVTAVTGRANVEVEVTGRAAHAGTTPMGDRQDAMVAAARMVLAVEALARDGRVRVATAGRLDVRPGVRNVVPSSATVSAEVRDVDDRRIADGLARLAADARQVSHETGCAVVVRPGPVTRAVPTDPRLQQCLRDAAAGLGLGTMDLPSGAGHDTQIVADVAPVGLVFVPSRGGVSHAPDESSDPTELVSGAELLLGALLLADERFDREEIP